jgi:hypothetical protein
MRRGGAVGESGAVGGAAAIGRPARSMYLVRVPAPLAYRVPAPLLTPSPYRFRRFRSHLRIEAPTPRHLRPRRPLRAARGRSSP